jgi:chromosome partitioning protein
VGISETCSVCGGAFDVQFRYQMEERDGGFSFYCSQKCLEKSQVTGADQGGSAAVTCDACAKRFQPDLVSQVLYLAGRRRYACSIGCRTQLLREAKGVRLGEIAAQVAGPEGAEAALGGEAPMNVPTMESPKPSLVPPVSSKRGEDAPLSSKARSARNIDGQVSVRVTTSASPKPQAPAQAAGTVVPVVPQTRRAGAAVPDAGGKVGSAAPKAQGPTAPEPKSGAPAIAPGVPRYLAVFNHKGGTGKTTTAVSVAAGLAARGKRVLLVDTDAQGNVSVSLGASSERSLYHVLVMGLRVSDATKTVRPNLDLLPSNETLAAAELYLAGRQNRDRVLCDRLSQAAASYDYVVLDCSPSLSLMNQNALVFADSVLVPVACDYLSLVGVRQVIKTVKNVNALLHHPVQIWGVLPTFFDARAKIAREAVSTLKSHFGDRCLAPIRAAIKVKEAPAQGQTIFEYAAGTPAAEDYAAIVDLIIDSRAGIARPSSAARDSVEPAAPPSSVLTAQPSAAAGA